MPSINRIQGLVSFFPAKPLPRRSPLLFFTSFPFAHSPSALTHRSLNHPITTHPLTLIMRLTLLVVALLSAMMIASACPAPKDNNKGFRGRQRRSERSAAAVNGSGRLPESALRAPHSLAHHSNDSDVPLLLSVSWSASKDAKVFTTATPNITIKQGEVRFRDKGQG